MRSARRSWATGRALTKGLGRRRWRTRPRARSGRRPSDEAAVETPGVRFEPRPDRRCPRAGVGSPRTCGRPYPWSAATSRPGLRAPIPAPWPPPARRARGRPGTGPPRLHTEVVSRWRPQERWGRDRRRPGPGAPSARPSRRPCRAAPVGAVLAGSPSPRGRRPMGRWGAPVGSGSGAESPRAFVAVPTATARSQGEPVGTGLEVPSLTTWAGGSGRGPTVLAEGSVQHRGGRARLRIVPPFVVLGPSRGWLWSVADRARAAVSGSVRPGRR
jgi:hypothetical protein